jgi:GAF domain-containing protein
MIESPPILPGIRHLRDLMNQYSPLHWQQYLSILQDISGAVVASDNIHTIADLMLDLAVRHTEAEKGSLMLFDNNRELYILCARGIDEGLQRTYRVKRGEGIAGTVAESGEPVLVRDISADERFRRFARDRYRTRSFISCPLKRMDSVLGVLNINDKKDGQPFSDDEFALIQIIANQAAVALKNSILLKKLESQAAELEEINRRLIDSDLAKTEFLTRISHELRTPINAIKGAAYFLQKSPEVPGKEREEFHGIIMGEAEKLAAFTEKQLDFLRLEDEARIVDRKPLVLSALLKETLNSRLLLNALDGKNIELRLDLPATVPEVVGDRILVGQLFINLLEGLGAHLESGSQITLRVEEAEDDVRVHLEASSPLPEDFLRTFSGSFQRNLARYGEYEKFFLALKAADAHQWAYQAENVPAGSRITLVMPKNRRLKFDAGVGSALDMILEFASEVLGVNTCSLMLSEELSGDLVIRSARGLDDDIVRRTRVRVGERIAGWVAHEGKPLLIENIEKDLRFARPNLGQYGSKSLLSFPLKAGGQVIGVVNLSNKKSGETFTSRDLRMASVLGDRISSLIGQLQSEKCTDEELEVLVDCLKNLIGAMDAYHKKTPRLLDLMDRVLQKIGAGEQERDLALYVAMVYDLGLMSIEKGLRGKKGKLTPPEVATFQKHPFTTLALLRALDSSEQVRSIILHHHEHFDGTGYPDGLRGTDIPLISRVLAVVDAYCAMTENRPYRKKMSREEALAEIRQGSGTIFDPVVVEALED